MTLKPWIKRTLIAGGAVAALGVGLATWAVNSPYGHGWRHGWHTLSEQDAAQIRAQVIDRVASRLELDATQKARLGPLADALREQRLALLARGTHPRSEIEPLIAGNTFDRSAAQRLLQNKIEAVNSKSPAVLTAFGDFYDSLRPEQQARLRDMLQRGRQHGRRG